ncbi:unnamed protein product, partial [Brugia timori]
MNDIYRAAILNPIGVILLKKGIPIKDYCKSEGIFFQ